MEIKDIISSGLLELHVLGMTTPAEAAEVQAWAMKYPEVKTEMDAIEISMEQYAMAHAIEPGAVLKEQIINKIDFASTPVSLEPAKVAGIAPFWKYAAAASILLLLGSALLNLSYYNRLEQADTALSATRQELIAANEKLDTMNADMGVIQNKYSKAVSFEGLPAAPDAAAKISWMEKYR